VGIFGNWTMMAFDFLKIILIFDDDFDDRKIRYLHLIFFLVKVEFFTSLGHRCSEIRKKNSTTKNSFFALVSFRRRREVQ